MPVSEFGAWPKKIISGPGAIDRLSSEVKKLGGKRVIVFSGPHISRTPMVLDPIEKMRSEGLEVALFNEIGANPTDEMVMAGVDAMKAFSPDVIVIIGGGSPLDCTKAANVVYTHGGKVLDYNVNTGGIMRITKPLLPFIAVPTTAGSGSEVTPVGVITSTELHVKFGVTSPKLIADVAVLDPNLTLGLGKKTTAYTGLDALTHLIEAYVSLTDNPIGDGICLQGIRMIKDALPVAYTDGNNIDARYSMLMASCMGGMVIVLKGLGLCHQMAHQLSAYFGAAHGLANALLLPHVMEFNLKAAAARYANVAVALGVDPSGLSTEELARKGIERVREMCREYDIPEYLDDIRVDKAQVPQMAVTALQDGVGRMNPVKTTTEECEAVFYECFK
ncbi:MAG: iron-containing alcohol dehydrogenase [Firmicutes bacterium]|nr:iron-containing alcohol dehydrogenase [Bacillota bacterium]